MRKKIKINWEWLFLAVVFLTLTVWAVTAPYNSSPDEGMRYDIVRYLMNHGKLPVGYDPEIRNALWGISYAFNPIISYIFSAIFGKVVSIFTTSEWAVLIAARMVNVIFGTLSAWFTMKIGKMLFEKEAARFFTAWVVFLPGSIFIHTYVNNDSMAMFSSAWILYCWVRAIKEGWTKRVYLQLAVAMSFCVLSYYNAYGYLLCSAIFFVGMMMKCYEKQWDYKQMLQKGCIMLAIVAVLAGWWFVRNAIIYDGDILGSSTSSYYAEMYAVDELKPSNRITPLNLGMSLPAMFIWQPGEWPYNWIMTVLVSFVGTFGYLNIFMPEWWSKVYILVLVLGFLGNCLHVREHFFPASWNSKKKKEKEETGVVITRVTRKEKVWNKENWLRVCMLIAMSIPPILLVYYAYASEFQAQGRYVMPALIPIMYFVVLGFDNIISKFVKNEKIRTYVYRVGTGLVVASSVLVYLCVYLPAYK